MILAFLCALYYTDGQQVHFSPGHCDCVGRRGGHQVFGLGARFHINAPLTIGNASSCPCACSLVWLVQWERWKSLQQALQRYLNNSFDTVYTSRRTLPLLSRERPTLSHQDSVPVSNTTPPCRAAHGIYGARWPVARRQSLRYLWSPCPRMPEGLHIRRAPCIVLFVRC